MFSFLYIKIIPKNHINEHENLIIQTKGDHMESLFKVRGTSLTIFVPQELDHHNAEMIRTGADRIIESQNIRGVIFDFAETQFMDSSGIGVIMGRYKNLRFMGGKVIAINVSDRIHRILTLSGIYKIVDIYDGLPHQSNLV